MITVHSARLGGAQVDLDRAGVVELLAALCTAHVGGVAAELRDCLLKLLISDPVS